VLGKGRISIEEGEAGALLSRRYVLFVAPDTENDCRLTNARLVYGSEDSLLILIQRESEQRRRFAEFLPLTKLEP